MIKINKQVAKSKISYFLEIHQIVLFFHCNNNVSLHRNQYLFELNKMKVTCQATSNYTAEAAEIERLQRNLLKRSTFFNNDSTVLRIQDNNETYQKQTFENQKPFKYLMVKNRVAKNVFLNLRTIKSTYYKTKELFFNERVCVADSLFQGPTLLLGCSHIKFIEEGIGIWSKHNGLILLGAFYDNSIIDKPHLKKLITYSNNDYGYRKLFSSMKSPFLHSFSLIRGLLNMRCFSVQQDRLICLLKLRKQQILRAAVTQ